MAKTSAELKKKATEEAKVKAEAEKKAVEAEAATLRLFWVVRLFEVGIKLLPMCWR